MFRFFNRTYICAVCKVIYILLLFLSGTKASAQVYYSTNPHYLQSKTERNNLLSKFAYNYPDTSVLELSNFLPRNFMGNMGLASPDYILRYGTDPIGFRFFNPPYTNDRVKENQVEYFKSLGPYASLTGIAGSKQLQIFRAVFTHTFKERLNITLKFQRYTSQGFYRQQRSYVNNLVLSSNYSTRNGRFGFYFFMLNNGIRHRENGGIQDTFLNDSTVFINKELMETRLDSAGRDNRENRVMINPWFRVNKKADTANGVNQFIQIKSRFVDQSFRHSDYKISKEGFYHVAYFDTVATFDSSHVRQFINEVDYSVVQTKNKFGLSFGYKNEINQLYQKTDSAFQNNMVVFDAVLRPALKKDTASKIERTFETRLNGGYVFSGPNAGNYKVESNSVLVTDEKKKRNVFIDLLVEQRNPDYIYNRWVSNHFLWLNNGFKAQQQVQLRVGYNLGRVFKFSIFGQNISNLLYFDKDALPKQLSGSVRNLGVSVDFTKVFFKHLGISLQHIFQNTSKPGYLRIPANITTGKLFFAANLFKSNLQFHLGGQIQIYETFKPYSYMPATQAFYLQDSYNTSGYPYLDVYLNVRIRPVSVFLKVENALQGYAGNNYAFVQGYYQPDRAFRFGINWMFFD